MKTGVLVAALALFIMSGVSYGYETEVVSNGAVIEGVVKAEGNIPGDETITVDTDKGYCGEKMAAEKYVISDGMVKNVVVWLDGVTKGKAVTREKVNITVSKCRINPLVSIAAPDGEFVFKNEDDILHTIQVKLWQNYHNAVSRRPIIDGATVINMAMPTKDLAISKPIKPTYVYSLDNGHMSILSNTHPFMRGYVYVFNNPYAAITDAKGSFVIKDVPPGQYTLKYWHEGLGLQTEKITVTAGTNQKVILKYSK